MVIENIIKVLKEFAEEKKETFNSIVEIFNDYFGKENVDASFGVNPDIFEKIKDTKLFLNALRIAYKNYYIRKDTIPSKIHNINALYFDNASLNDFENFEDLNIIEIKQLYDNIISNYCNSTNIIIYFKEIFVTNEYNKTHLIRDVFYKITFTPNLYIKNTHIIRSTYSEKEIKAKYIFSHCPILSVGEKMSEWKIPCYGSGPIKRTLNNLANDIDLDLYGLLCNEIVNYLHTESVEGGPYISLKNVNNTNQNKESLSRSAITLNHVTKKILKDFTSYYISNCNLKITKQGIYYILAENPTDAYLKISNTFITWWNTIYEKDSEYLQVLYNSNILLNKVKLSLDNVLYREKDYRSNIDAKQHIGWPILKFKDKVIYSNVLLDKKDESKYFIILNPSVIKYIINIILNCLNIYGNNSNFINKKYNH
jgi:hypothetical protein